MTTGNLMTMSDDALTVIRQPEQPRIPNGLTPDDLQRMYRTMILVRAMDERCLKLQRSGRIGFYITSFGEEAAQVGSAAAFEPQDWMFPHYRVQGVGLYRGMPLETVTHQLFGNVEDATKGRQMPVHYSHRATNYVSISSVIGTQIVQAVGVAMAAQIRKDPVVACAYFGDGSTSANDFHSAMTFAGATHAPVVLICVNNQYAISTPISKQTGCSVIAKKGEGYGIPGIRVDGNDVLAVYEATREAVQRARNGEGPTLLELFTYRLSSHSSSDDPSRYRDQNEAAEWQNRDPLLRFRQTLELLGLWTDTDEQQAWEEARQQVNSAISAAEKAGPPDGETLFEDVYAEIPPSLAAQRDEWLATEAGASLANEGEFPL
jgi:pyruvate dehydrogenase E1 component alpha subunit